MEVRKVDHPRIDKELILCLVLAVVGVGASERKFSLTLPVRVVLTGIYQ